MDGRGVAERPREGKLTRRVCDRGSGKRRSYEEDEVCDAVTWYRELQRQQDRNYLLNLALGRLWGTSVRTTAVREVPRRDWVS